MYALTHYGQAFAFRKHAVLKERVEYLIAFGRTGVKRIITQRLCAAYVAIIDYELLLYYEILCAVDIGRIYKKIRHFRILVRFN